MCVVSHSWLDIRDDHVYGYVMASKCSVCNEIYDGRKTCHPLAGYTYDTKLTVDKLRAVYADRLAEELRIVDSLPVKPRRAQLDRAMRAAERTNVVIRMLTV